MKKLLFGLLLITGCAHFQSKSLNHFDYESDKCKKLCAKLDEVVSSFTYIREPIDTSKNTIGDQRQLVMM